VQPPSGQGDAVLDLGCGTGLAGAAFRDRAAWLEGIDLSPRMVAAAEARRIYDRVGVDEIGAFLAAPPRRYDIALAADTLVYIGDLAPILAGAAGALSAGGLFAFTLQEGAGAPYTFGPEHRYSHNPAYVLAAAAEAGFEAARVEEASYRTEKARPVPGLVVVLRRRGV
jgi:predicted TPR repeat methyltransferase